MSKPITHVWMYMDAGLGGSHGAKAEFFRERGWAVGEAHPITDKSGLRWVLPMTMALADPK